MSTTSMLHTRDAVHALQLRAADNFFSRFAGLMLRAPLAPDAGLLLTRCNSVHTAWMRQTIDVLYLDAQGVVLKCVPQLRPWRLSAGLRQARHTLELAAGSIARLGIAVGDRVQHPLLAPRASGAVATAGTSRKQQRQRGATVVEFAVVGPVITLVGLVLVQYGVMFFAKSQISHAGFMAARAGSTGNANIDTIRSAYTTALVPLYGGGQSATELATSLAEAAADVSLNTRIEMLNPTKESFDDWNDKELQALLSDPSKRVIRNASQAFRKERSQRGATSGQTPQEANMLKLRITQGYKPPVPVVSNIYTAYLRWMDPRTDSFHTQMVNAGRIPLVSEVTIHMQSDAIEGKPVSTPGQGNNGSPSNPGDTPTTPGKPPSCNGALNCTTPDTPPDSGTPTTPADPGTPPPGTCYPASRP